MRDTGQMNAPDLRSQHARVVRASVEVVANAGIEDLPRPTPCGEWNLGDLLAHMTVQHDGFAAAAAGNGGDPTLWVVQPLGSDPFGAYAAAADRVVTAFAQDGVPEREFALPEISPITTFPGSQAMSFHLIDYVVHGWDVARTLDIPVSFDPDVLDTAIEIARSVPDGPQRLQPGSAFAPGLAAAGDAPQLDRIVAMLGRDPGWTSPT